MNSKLNAEQRERRDREIVKRYNAGENTKAIAATWGITPMRVVQILNAAGVQMR